MSTDVYEDLVFHCTDDRFFIESSQSSQLIVIDRISHEISLEIVKDQIPFSASQKKIYGILGIVHLVSGPYLILITKRLKIGSLNGENIWQLEDVDIIPYSRSLVSLTAEQRVYNDKYVSLLSQVLFTPHFYFSYSYDLTHTLQRLYYTAEEFLQIPLHERADVRFFWNQHLLREFTIRGDLGRFCLPIMQGFVSIKLCSINGKLFKWALVSRRSVYRAGTRMWMRGIDQEGSVANYVETEQIVEAAASKNYRSSFVLTRGSIPLFWSQEPNLKYKPTPLIAESVHEEAFARHCESQVLIYGRQIFVNLIDQKGVEGQLQENFRDSVLKSDRQLIKANVGYEFFDFHHECRKMRWDRLDILLDRLAPEQKSMSYFLLREGVILREQEGTFRVNCIDCLDRTNVVQSMLARRQLQDALLRMDILNTDQKIEDQVAFELHFKNTWADNADYISIQYAGTGALKTDFTRTGKRTRAGLVKDGWNSAVRYIKNNFMDGDRQDGIDLFLGKYIVESSEGGTKPSPLKDDRDQKLMLLPVSVLFSLLMVFACVLLVTEYTSFTLISLLFWVGVTVIAVMVTLSQGDKLVNIPKLCQTLRTSTFTKVT